MSGIFRSFARSAGPILASAIALAACGTPRPDLRISQVDLSFGPATLDKAAADFLGPAPAPAPVPGSETGGEGIGGVIGGSGLKADLALDGVRGREVALGMRIAQPLSERWQMETSLRAGQASVQRTLPAGSLRLGRLVLMAEGTMTARTRFIEAESLALREMPEIMPDFLPGRLELGAGLGARVTQSRLRVTLDTLFPIDARSAHQQTQPFATVQARYTWPKLPARAFAEARIYGRNQAGLRAGLDVILP